jgi:hypothetical protein
MYRFGFRRQRGIPNCRMSYLAHEEPIEALIGALHEVVAKRSTGCVIRRSLASYLLEMTGADRRTYCCEWRNIPQNIPHSPPLSG